ncbi:YqaJ-like viral recombinase domain containing protein, putative [Angomonas deanei]|uniref:YqaJ-like viral recombinase domain containing protein, putative n=1 Tax=Angomonas deanei TaxID=59799 RepID=A0A7G2CB29_9TRYP|nr:YqaJ-like viral recombinase domain containing protein, putative [Angomonas deanei]
MAQQPAKLDWKKRVDFGLSASQFGMALGFCGKISDYVHYLRNVVGTEMEFTGNACTAHGIRTEPKSRALYELITGCKVHDGSFFLSQDGFLGCSPDGRIFYDVSEPLIVGSSTAGRGSATDLLSESNDSLADSQQRTCVSLPFSIKRSRSGNFSDTSSVTVRHQKVRLLEIKSSV